MPVIVNFLDELKGRIASYMTVYTDSSLYANFNFDGNTTNFLDPLGARAATSGSFPAPTYVAGKYNSAARISSAGTITQSLADTTTFSLVCWVRFPDTTSAANTSFMIAGDPSLVTNYGFWRTGSFVSAIFNGTKSTTIHTISDTSSYNLFSAIKNGTSASYWLNSSSIFSTSSAAATASAGSKLRLAQLGVATDYDKLMFWDKSLSQNEMSWIVRGFTGYIAEESDNIGISYPAFEIIPEADRRPDYWMGTNVDKSHIFTIALGFKYGDHSRVVDGATYSDRKLADYYAETLEKALNAADFTTSNLNETRREVQVNRYVERNEQLYLGGCVGSLQISRHIDWGV